MTDHTQRYPFGARVRVRDLVDHPLARRRGVVVQRPQREIYKLSYWDTAVSIDGVHYWFEADELEPDAEEEQDGAEMRGGSWR